MIIVGKERFYICYATVNMFTDITIYFFLLKNNKEILKSREINVNGNISIHQLTTYMT